MRKSKVIFGRSLWKHCIGELRRRGNGKHESGCFVLSSSKRNNRKVRRCIFYDELDATAYSSGVCILGGDSFSKLWEICRRDQLTVIADIHTHPGNPYQSELDRTNPMIARPGHVAVIVPRFAEGTVWRHRLGLYRYEGDHEWTNLSGWQARTVLKIRWSLL